MSDKCDSCNGTGYKGGIDPLDFKDYPDAGRLVFEECGRCGGNGKAGDYASVDLDDGNCITRKGGVWRPSQMRGNRGELTIGTASESAQRALGYAEERVKHLREALKQWGSSQNDVGFQWFVCFSVARAFQIWKVELDQLRLLQHWT